jgi:Zn-dependent peptidase ImmA (M78 family)
MTELELIHYNLNCLGGVFDIDELQILIAKTIHRLPKELWEEVPEKVTFICADKRYGMYAKLRISPFDNGELHFILLNIDNIEDEEEKMYVIAHEIAHFVLGHSTEDTAGQERDIEEEADNLTESWGFRIPERRREQK